MVYQWRDVKVPGVIIMHVPPCLGPVVALYALHSNLHRTCTRAAHVTPHISTLVSTPSPHLVAQPAVHDCVEGHGLDAVVHVHTDTHHAGRVPVKRWAIKVQGVKFGPLLYPLPTKAKK